ncbi:MAG: leucine-rich repeat domain-containing protein, partial [Bacteroidales bacterium]|nr:leucine-rich repeat domain-containing protein [Bacteroidales bacterium]
SSITIPASVTSIGKQAFYSCYNSSKKTGLTEVTFAEGSKLETIGESAFNGCKVLSSITIPASVTSIGQSAFSGCSALSSITIPASVTSIGKQAFYGCTKLETVTFAEGSKLETIGESAFNGCKVLSSITIQASVTSIGNFAFQYCYALESINIPASVTSFGWAPFNGCTGLEAISVDAGNPVFSSPDGCNAIIETAKNTLIQGCKNTVIPESVKIIGTYAFQNMATLESIDIPASVTSISSCAFQFCDKLKSVTIPASSVLESLGSNAFGTCKALESINIPASVTSLEDYTFNFCSNLKSVTVNWAEADKIVQINSKVFKDVYEGMTLIVPAGTESLYAAATGWSSYAEKMKVYIPVTLRRGLDSRDNYIGYFATFYSSESAYDLTGTNTKAYTGVLEDIEDEYEVKVLKLKDAGNIIGQGMGVVLKYAGEDQGSETIDIVLMPSEETATAGENILAGTDVELSWEDIPENTYALSKSKEYGVGFYYSNYEGWTIAAHKAYLTLSDPYYAKAFIFQFDGEPTGIKDVQGSMFNVQGSVYNLNGVRVNDNYKGIVIKNGKKFYQK